MNESISTSYLVMIVAILITIFSVIIISFFTYSRAFKTKNKIVDIIEKHEGYDSNTILEIDNYLRQVGYSVKRTSVKCPVYNDAQAIINNGTYAYCIYEFPTNRGKYYGVIVFMNINFPIIQDVIELKVRGQTRTIYDL